MFLKVLFSLLLLLCAGVSAQQQSAGNINKIQLEATIRGAKEQPKVLSIVPWQLPEHRALAAEPPDPFAPVQLKPLLRPRFIAEQQLYQQLFNSSSERSPTYSNQP